MAAKARDIPQMFQQRKARPNRPNKPLEKQIVIVAERVGFEPTVRYSRTHTFQACSLNRSDTSPKRLVSQPTPGQSPVGPPI